MRVIQRPQAVEFEPDLKIADVKAERYVGFVFPGMAGPMDGATPADLVTMAQKAVAAWTSRAC